MTTSSSTSLPDLAIRLIEVIAAGRPEAASPQQTGDNDWQLWNTAKGPVAIRLFPGQDNLKLRIPTRSDEGLRLAIGAQNRRAASLRVQSSFNSKEWLVDLRPGDDYDYIKAIAECLWPR